MIKKIDFYYRSEELQVIKDKINEIVEFLNKVSEYNENKKVKTNKKKK